MQNPDHYVITILDNVPDLDTGMVRLAGDTRALFWRLLQVFGRLEFDISVVRKA